MAKVMLYQSSPYNGKNGTNSRWAELKPLLEAIMASGKDNKGTGYRLADSYESLYVARASDWKGEAVLDMLMALSGVQTNTSVINGSSHFDM